jgi:exopolysaccharide biosynthesis protein
VSVPSTSTNPTVTPSPTAPSLNTWVTAAPGIELRYEQWTSEGNNQDAVTIVRLDPKRIHLSVAYQSTLPPTMSDWMKQTQGRVLINGGYFDKNNKPTGLLIADGQAYGASYQGFGGMISVDAQGRIHLRSLSQEPYDPQNEQLQQAAQSSPMLMLNGKRTQFQANAASQRRSVIATDTHGHLLLIISPNDAFSLDELADLLVSSDLSLQNALNLDGGASTGLYVNAGSQKVTIDPLVTLPIVIVIK